MSRTDVFSIFGQIEAIVAKEMGFKQIPYWDIPESVRFNAEGEKAQFAVIVPRQMLAEFEDRIARLRN